jgi:hypothetical protein
VVAPDEHVTARIKELKQKITGSKREDNEWRLDEGVEGKIGPGNS